MSGRTKGLIFFLGCLMIAFFLGLVAGVILGHGV